MPSVGPLEVVIVLVVALLIMGPKRLPEAGRSLGQGLRGFRDGLSPKSDSASVDDERVADS